MCYLLYSKHGQIVASRSWCPPGHRWALWHPQQPLWPQMQWQVHRDRQIGGVSLHLWCYVYPSCLDAVILPVSSSKTFGGFSIFCRKVNSHGNHYSSMMPHHQPLLTNPMAMSAHQPISIGIAHVVWPQPATNKRNKVSSNRSVSSWLLHFVDNYIKYKKVNVIKSNSF